MLLRACPYRCADTPYALLASYMTLSRSCICCIRPPESCMCPYILCIVPCASLHRALRVRAQVLREARPELRAAALYALTALCSMPPEGADGDGSASSSVGGARTLDAHENYGGEADDADSNSWRLRVGGAAVVLCVADGSTIVRAQLCRLIMTLTRRYSQVSHSETSCQVTFALAAPPQPLPSRPPPSPPRFAELVSPLMADVHGFCLTSVLDRSVVRMQATSYCGCVLSQQRARYRTGRSFLEASHRSPRLHPVPLRAADPHHRRRRSQWTRLRPRRRRSPSLRVSLPFETHWRVVIRRARVKTQWIRTARSRHVKRRQSCSRWLPGSSHRY